MRKETISVKQGIACVALFLLGNAVLTGGDRSAGRDNWLIILGLTVLTALLGMLYARILQLYPERSFFEILRHVFGRVAGTALTLIMVIYFLQMYALVIADFGIYAAVVSLPTTSVFLIALPIVFLSFFLAIKGIRVIGRVSLALLVYVIFYFLINILLVRGYLRAENLFPVLRQPAGELATSAINLLAFPFAEIIVLLPAMSRLHGSRYKAFGMGILMGGVILAYSSFRNLLMLGEGIYMSNYYPSFIAISLVSVGDYLQHIEMMVSFTMLICIFVKAGLCLFGAQQGLKSVFQIKNLKGVLLVIAAVATIAVQLLVVSPQDMRWFGRTIYPYYALPIQIGLPLACWIGAEVKKRKEKGAVIAK